MGPDKNKYDKYENYKSSWIKIDNGDLELIEPISVKRFVFPNDNGFYIEILLNNKIVGSFHCYYDEDEGQMNDIEILPEYRNIGLGKILLLKAIELSNDIFGGFSSDVRGLTKEQEQVYRSLNKDGALVNWSEINYKRAQEVIDLISEKLNNNMNLQESIRRILREELTSHNGNESKRHKVFYGFQGLPNFWSDDYDGVVNDSYFDDKDYNDYYFDNFYDMDKEFGHEKSLFGTKGLPVGHPKRSSKSFDMYNDQYGPAIVRVVEDTNLQKQEHNEGELTERCWPGYTQKGMKTMFGKRYPNCVKKTKK